MHPRLQMLWDRKQLLIFILVPLLLLPLPLISPTPEAQVAYLILVMAAYWVTEALPIGVTALIPVVAVPAFKIVSSKDLCPSYFEDSNMLFIGGLILAISVEYWNLHKRIALAVLQVVGVQPRWLLLGFMLPTWFMSMWISNTATSAMMLPIVDAVLHQLMKHHRLHKEAAAAAVSSSLELSQLPADDSSGGDEKAKAPKELTALEYMQLRGNEDFAKICKMLTISVAYAANIGGTATLTGTAPNLVLNNNVDNSFKPGHPFGFATWFAFAFPISLICVTVAWLWLQILFLGPRNFVKCRGGNQEETEAVKMALKKEYQKLGSITYPEISCIVLFCIAIVLWVTREPGFKSWGSLFTVTKNVTELVNGSVVISQRTTSFMADAQPAILMSILLFVIPSSNPFKRHSNSVDIVVEVAEVGEDGEQTVQSEETTDFVEEKPSTLLSWPVVHRRLPWGIVLLLGGGFALAKATKESGLSALIGGQLEPLGGLPYQLLILIVVYCTALVTEITSNTATASILLPILVDLSRTIKLHPFILMLPCTVACSLAFNLPVATPPNSIVFSKGYLTVTDMMKSGFVLTILCNLVVIGCTLTYGAALFNFPDLPDWANATTATSSLLSSSAFGFRSEFRAEGPNWMSVGNE